MANELGPEAGLRGSSSCPSPETCCRRRRHHRGGASRGSGRPGRRAPAGRGLHRPPPAASGPARPRRHSSPRPHAARPLPAPAPPGRAVQTHRDAGAARRARAAGLRAAGSRADRLWPRRLPPRSAGASHCEPSGGPSSRLRSSSRGRGCQEGKHPGIPEERAGRRRPLPAPAPCSPAHAATFQRTGVCLACGARPPCLRTAGFRSRRPPPSALSSLYTLSVPGIESSPGAWLGKSDFTLPAFGMPFRRLAKVALRGAIRRVFEMRAYLQSRLTKILRYIDNFARHMSAIWVSP